MSKSEAEKLLKTHPSGRQCGAEGFSRMNCSSKGSGGARGLGAAGGRQCKARGPAVEAGHLKQDLREAKH